jgi:hypothetical protein
MIKTRFYCEENGDTIEQIRDLANEIRHYGIFICREDTTNEDEEVSRIAYYYNLLFYTITMKNGLSVEISEVIQMED